MSLMLVSLSTTWLVVMLLIMIIILINTSNKLYIPKIHLLWKITFSRIDPSCEENNKKLVWPNSTLHCLKSLTAVVHITVYWEKTTFNLLTLTIIPILFVSEVKGNICKISNLVVESLTGVFKVIVVRSLWTKDRPTLSVHFTRATW